eukprot:8216707-Karenia_brevis.AAC.1
METVLKQEHAQLPQSDTCPHPHDEEEKWLAEWYKHAEFMDDVSGKPLNKSLPIKAFMAEVQFFRKIGVYTKIARADAIGKVITTRWIDVNKGDDKSPDYR